MKFFKKRKKIKEKSSQGSQDQTENPTDINTGLKKHKSGVRKFRRVGPNAINPVSANMPDVNIPDANPPPPVGMGGATLRVCPSCGEKTLNHEGLCTSCGWQEVGMAHPTWTECPNCGDRTLNEEHVCTSCGWHEVGMSHAAPGDD